MDSARGPASPLTETSDVEDDSAPTSPTRLAMWNTVTNPDGEISKSEKRLSKFEDGAGPLLDASKGIITVIKTIGANEEVQMMGKSILSGIPTLMATVKAISTVHPFVALAFLPFQFAYEQEMKRHDNEKYLHSQRANHTQKFTYPLPRLRLSLFDSIKDVILVLRETDGLGVTKHDERTEPNGTPLVSRLTELGQQMDKDIHACYNVLDAMEKQKLIMKVFKARGWNEKLAYWKDNFKKLQNDLHFALSLNTAKPIHDMGIQCVKFIMEFEKYKTAEERKIEGFLRAHGGEKKVIDDESKCLELLKLQDELTVTHDISSNYASTAGASNYAAGASASNRRGGQESGKAESRDKDAIAKLRKEYRTDVAVVSAENLDSFSKRLKLNLSRVRQDLKSDIHEEGSRMIKVFKSGPHMRVRDEIMRQVWKDQGWRGSAKTRTLVLALRDYLVERAEHTNGELRPPSPPSPSGSDEEDARNRDSAMKTPLPDNWMLDYLQVKRLRNLQQILDPDTSGFSRVVGGRWQIHATRYCIEIDEIFNQMSLIRSQVRLQMPGNTRCINNYMASTWPLVVGLTSAINRFQGSDSLADQFKEYIDAQENVFCSRLDIIKYDIDSTETVQEIISGEPIERWIFMLIAVILRRHLAKMHLSLSMEMNEEELGDDGTTIQFVAEAAWLRYNTLLDYFTWKDWKSEKYFQKNEIISYSAVSTITEIDAKKDILVYAAVNQKVDTNVEPTIEKDDPRVDTPDGANGADGSNRDGLKGSLLGIDNQVGPNGEVEPGQMNTMRTQETIDEILYSLSGVWFGFHTTEEGLPYTGMFYLKMTTSMKEGKIDVQGIGSSFAAPDVGKLTGGVTMTPTSDGHFKVELRQEFDTDEYTYHVLLTPDLQILTGGLDTLYWGSLPGIFIAKKTASERIMCYRPLFPRRLTARELWLFAYNAVVGDLRRCKPTIAYFAERSKMFRRCLQLLHRCDSSEQFMELGRLQNAFTAGEYVEILRLAGWYNRACDLHQILLCDVCREILSRSRVICLECESKDDNPVNSVEFDAKEECITSAALNERDDLLTPHLVTHLLLKTRDRLFLMDYTALKERAKISAALAGRLYKPMEPLTEEPVGNVQTTSTSDATESQVVESIPPDSSSALATAQEAVSNSESLAPGGSSVSFAPDVVVNPPAEEEHSSTVVVSPMDKTAHQPPSTDPNETLGDLRDENDKPSQALEPYNTADEAITLDCLICRQRVSTPCWYCIDCEQTDTFVCATCELEIERLFPWDYLKQYRKEVNYHRDVLQKKGSKQPLATFDSPGHNVLHLLVRFGNTECKREPGLLATGNGKENVLEVQQDNQLSEYQTMVALLKSVAAIAVATNVRIVSTLQGTTFDLSNNHCINLQPVQASVVFNPAIPHQQARFQVNIADPVAGTFKIVHTACNFPLTYSGSTIGADPLRAGLVIVKGSPTVFSVVPADPSIPSGPFNIIETKSGLALTNWRFNPGTVNYSPVTLEFLIREDTRQSFSFVAG
ncbi:hypothetical protein C8J57DRAFT_1525807 [Mycena rebaudengoi]|nr:hypothetical protein C8J57DRAFT_1525807 [Mycena rebaudengoi]